MISTRAVEVSIHATSPLLGVGAGVGVALGAAAGAAAAGGGAAGAGAAGAAAGAAGLSWAMSGAHQPTAPSRAKIAKSFLIVISLRALPPRFHRCGCG